MSDEEGPTNLVLRGLRAIDVKLDIVRHEVQALKGHSIAMADTLVALRKDIQNLEQRVARIETRLDLRETI